MNGDEMDYVRAMAYGPSQGEFTRDALYGPFGRLQPGDIAMSPNLQDKYPLGSMVQVHPPGGDPFIVRVADHSYHSPGVPNTNAIEFWNGQDLGHVHITPAPAQSQPTATSQALQRYDQMTGLPVQTYPVVPWQDQPQPPAAPAAPASTPTQDFAKALGKGIGQAGQDIAKSTAASGQQVMKIMSQSNPFLQMLQQIAANPVRYGPPGWPYT
jgi:hypothetical protein